LAEKIAEINAAAVRAAREARARFVIADVGPTGEYLPPVGNGDPEAWKRAFEAQGRLLGRAGVDALHLETFSDLREALIALEAIRAAVPGIPVFASMTFDRKKSGFHSVMGNPLAGSLRALVGAGADAVGANCTLASSDMKALAAEARGAVDVPLVIQPNAGQPEIMAGSLRYSQEPEAFAADLAAIAAFGVEAVGGCCGTDPRFIAALRPLLAGPRAARRSEG
jgi:methionine synthase I (cobalamin-dependent)